MSKVKVYFDGGCPVYTCYTCSLKIENAQYIDARSSQATYETLKKKGFDLDKGMVVQIGKDYFYAEKAFAKLSEMNESTSLISKFNKKISRNENLNGTLYPLLVSFRNLLLKVLRKEHIENYFKNRS